MAPHSGRLLRERDRGGERCGLGQQPGSPRRHRTHPAGKHSLSMGTWEPAPRRPGGPPRQEGAAWAAWLPGSKRGKPGAPLSPGPRGPDGTPCCPPGACRAPRLRAPRTCATLTQATPDPSHLRGPGLGERPADAAGGRTRGPGTTMRRPLATSRAPPPLSVTPARPPCAHLSTIGPRTASPGNAGRPLSLSAVLHRVPACDWTRS